MKRLFISLLILMTFEMTNGLFAANQGGLGLIDLTGDCSVGSIISDNSAILVIANASSSPDNSFITANGDTITISSTNPPAQFSPQSVICTIDTSLTISGAYVGGVQGHTATMRNNAVALKNAPKGPSGPTHNLVNGLNVWGDTFGSWGDQDELNGKMGYEWDTYGGVVGMDKVFANTLVGFSFGYSETDVEADEFATSDISTYNLGLYATYTMEKIWFDGGLSYAWGNIESARDVSSINRVAKCDTGSGTWTLYGGLGYEHVVGKWTFAPSLNFKYSDYKQDKYTEKGALGANLRVNKFDKDSFTSTLGFDTSYQIKNNLKVTFKTAWVHEYCNNQATLKAAFAGAQTFKTKGIDPADNSGVFGIGIEGNIRNNIETYCDYSYEIKDNFDAHNITIGMRVNF